MHSKDQTNPNKTKIESVGPVEIMDVIVWGLPPNTDFDFFVIQVPNKPFGLAWYQGDIETNRNGEGYGKFIGRFSIETFIVSLASVPAPVVFHNGMLADPLFEGSKRMREITARISSSSGGSNSHFRCMSTIAVSR